MLPRARTLKRGLLLFWALWLSVVVATNVLDCLQFQEVPHRFMALRPE